jgi:hypothetical protein
MDIKNTVVTVEVVYRFDYNLEDWGDFFSDKSEAETKEALIEDAMECIEHGGTSAFSSTATVAALNGEV